MYIYSSPLNLNNEQPQFVSGGETPNYFKSSLDYHYLNNIVYKRVAVRKLLLKLRCCVWGGGGG